VVPRARVLMCDDLSPPESDRTQIISERGGTIGVSRRTGLNDSEKKPPSPSSEPLARLTIETP